MIYLTDIKITTNCKGLMWGGDGLWDIFKKYTADVLSHKLYQAGLFQTKWVTPAYCDHICPFI